MGRGGHRNGVFMGALAVWSSTHGCCASRGGLLRGESARTRLSRSSRLRVEVGGLSSEEA